MGFKTLVLFSTVAVLFVVVESRVNILDITTKQVFDIAVTRNARRPVIVFYTKPPCGACTYILNKLKTYARENSEHIDLAIVDLSKTPDLEDILLVDSIPSTRLFYKGDVQGEVTGSSWRDVKDLADFGLNL